jgi:hypothetical protein
MAVPAFGVTGAPYFLWRAGVRTMAAAAAGASADLKYTLPGYSFTQAEREQYERDGFIVIRKLVPQKDLDAVRERCGKER